MKNHTNFVLGKRTKKEKKHLVRELRNSKQNTVQTPVGLTRYHANACGRDALSFKQIWVDLHQTMVLDREGSYTRPVLGLVRCVCKDETEQTGRTSPIKMRTGVTIWSSLTLLSLSLL